MTAHGTHPGRHEDPPPSLTWDADRPSSAPRLPCACQCHCRPISSESLWIRIEVLAHRQTVHDRDHQFEWFASCPLCAREDIGIRLVSP